MPKEISRRDSLKGIAMLAGSAFLAACAPNVLEATPTAVAKATEVPTRTYTPEPTSTFTPEPTITPKSLSPELIVKLDEDKIKIINRNLEQRLIPSLGSINPKNLSEAEVSKLIISKAEIGKDGVYLGGQPVIFSDKAYEDGSGRATITKAGIFAKIGVSYYSRGASDIRAQFMGWVPVPGSEKGEYYLYLKEPFSKKEALVRMPFSLDVARKEGNEITDLISNEHLLVWDLSNSSPSQLPGDYWKIAIWEPATLPFKIGDYLYVFFGAEYGDSWVGYKDQHGTPWAIQVFPVRIGGGETFLKEAGKL